MIILGIDPGSRITGYGFVRYRANRFEYLGSGCVRLPDGGLPERLDLIFKAVSQLIEQFAPDQFAIEEVFVAKNAGSALKLGQARGAAIVAATSAGIPVYEYSARKVKQAVVGKGGADKSQVQHMVKHILKLPGMPQADAADALAIAICHSHMRHALSTVVAGQKIKLRRRTR